jgi:membrane protein YqaA with SNARE-associated domain
MRALTRWLLSVFASPAGVFALAALDSTTFFWFPLGIDAAVIVLAARGGRSPWIAPLVATAGSIGGASLTFWMGRKIGEKGLDRHIPEKRLEKLRRRIRRSGAVTLAALDLIPPPFPSTVMILAAGALDVKATMFFATLLGCRSFRFGLEAYLALRYGRGIVHWLDSDVVRDVVTVFIVGALAVSSVMIVKFVRMARAPRRRAAA